MLIYMCDYRFNKIINIYSAVESYHESESLSSGSVSRGSSSSLASSNRINVHHNVNSEPIRGILKKDNSAPKKNLTAGFALTESEEEQERQQRQNRINNRGEEKRLRRKNTGFIPKKEPETIVRRPLNNNTIGQNQTVAEPEPELEPEPEPEPKTNGCSCTLL
eukprot:TRINITY_DN8702_c0_g1_i1.p1 TRINITY_DN8702_c0_g1~~TRINITY_DN8702_c0_g1_i1.p1  ORF type:complete len:163 (+),score=21.92 TRINITY_DN8702_c0_g1_i1:406-894(+)